MRKQFIPPTPATVRPQVDNWLDLESVASVEVTPEDGSSLLQSALVPGEPQGWRAAIPGTQTIRLVFEEQEKTRK